ncbi:MAG: CBS domain-containing protein, partial [Xanthomonadaceae bacterium]|nr:CBS domain-containing protein [Xanthomonadaceae bacterium]
MVIQDLKMSFAEDTVGSLMSHEFIRIPEDYTADEAIVYLRQNVRGKANIHYIYVVDSTEKIKGVLSLRELLGAKGALILKEFMKKELIVLDSNLDQELAARIFQDTDLVTIPVVDEERHMIGVIHVDAMMDVMQEEAT